MEKINKTQKEIPNSENNLQDGKTEEQLSESAENEKLQIKTNKVAEEGSEKNSIEALKNQLETLMNSLAVLSAEKSRMESNFQSEKKQIRNEREEYEKVIKNLKDKLKRIHGHASSETEHLKYKLIMERHEREKDQVDYNAAAKDLQKRLSNEQKARENLESQLKELKNTTLNKSQTKLLETELDLLKNKLKQAEADKNETPAMLLNLQTEMSIMKKKHKNAILEEQRRAASAEQKARALAASHESRVAGLEARLAELSDIVGGYDRLRHQDQKAIHKLKEQLIILQNSKKDTQDSPQYLIDKIRSLYFKLMEIDKNSSSSNTKDLLNSLKLCDKNEDHMYKEKYEAISQEFEEFKKRSAISEINHQIHEKVSVKDETQLQRAKSHNKNLEEKLRMLISEMSEKEKEFKVKLEEQQKFLQDQFLKTEHLLSQKDGEYLNKIATLEQQLLRQRERSLSVIQEKDKEIQTLKSSFDALLPKKNITLDTNSQKFNAALKHAGVKGGEVNDLISGLLVENNPPMLHYTQELARKDVQISGLRKQNVQMEAALRELERNTFRVAEKNEEEVKKLENQIKRLEASKSREGANLEYLKNVFINFLTSKDSAGKRHMLNAISTVLQFTPEESEKINKIK